MVEFLWIQRSGRKRVGGNAMLPNGPVTTLAVCFVAVRSSMFFGEMCASGYSVGHAATQNKYKILKSALGKPGSARNLTLTAY